MTDLNESSDKYFARRGHGLEFEMEASWVHGRLPTASRRVMDIGCGIGGLFGAIGPGRALGVDCCEDGLRRTKERYPATPLLCAAAEQLPLAGGVFDALTCQHVIEHIPTYRHALRDWFRMLRPGGVLLLLTPNARFQDPSVFADDAHVTVFDRAGLRDLLLDTGFEITDLRTIGLPWFRNYQRVVSGWRLRRLVTRRANLWSAVPFLRWKGQTLCCAARRPVS